MRQTEIKQFIASYIEANGRGPTAGEIQEHFRYGSKASVLKHLDRMQKKGMIHRPAYRKTRTGQSTTTQITLQAPAPTPLCPHCRAPLHRR